MTSAEIRQQFLDFFAQKHAHTVVPSSPVVPHDDPTLLFTNAGMNQFKPIFLGQEKRAYTRAVDTQKCIRAGGKHNDLDDVGRSRRHHTFFEMLGNWSFGDYFKQGAIEMSWELLTKVWKLDPTRLHVSCFEGDPANGVPRDTESADIWKKVANWEQYGEKSEDHIHYFGKDNFWEMGDTGPCGPCTEIYIDRTPDKSGGPQVNGEDPRVMEIWNNVFIQYNRNPDRSLTPLPAQHVDTGMGFERICQVLQDVDSNYSIDLWHPFWDKLKELSGHTYSGKFPPTNSVDAAAEAADEGLRKDIAFRVIGDHIRCLTFALTDGAVPSNEGRGYVLRRILRRAVRFGRQSLGLKDPFLYRLVDVVVKSMGPAFRELEHNPSGVAEIIREEEVSFGRTLDRGIALFNAAANDSEQKLLSEASAQVAKNDFGPFKSSFAYGIFNRENDGTVTLKRPASWDVIPNAPRPVISAASAFQLHDTFGFPIDLTQIMAAERGMSVDLEGYETLMEEARAKARAGGKSGDDIIYDLPPDALAELEANGVPRTDDDAKYAGGQLKATVKAIWRGDELVTETPPCVDVALILDKTNFYAEMGGQVGDTGSLVSETATFDVFDTHDVGGFILHIGRCSGGSLKIGDPVTLTVDERRQAIQNNHTSTHLANWALREVLGEGVQQKGSLVDADKLRFDFSHNKSLEEAELARVEQLVNQELAKQLPVYAEEAPQEQALKINGLRAVFGEKYPPMVRVVSIGAPVKDLLADPGNAKWRQFSVEFCGGTHLKNAGEAKQFVITSEESVSKGVRRLVALTGLAASAASKSATDLDASISKAQAIKNESLAPSIASIQKSLGEQTLPLLAKRRGQAAVLDLQQKQKAFEKSQKQQGSGLDAAKTADDLIAASGGLGIVSRLDGTDDELRAVLDSLKAKQPSVAALLASSDGTKLTFIAAVSDDLIKKGLKAGDWVKEAAKIAGGGGGGRPNLAQAGGKDVAKLDEALIAARAYAGKIIG